MTYPERTFIETRGGFVAEVWNDPTDDCGVELCVRDVVRDKPHLSGSNSDETREEAQCRAEGTCERIMAINLVTWHERTVARARELAEKHEWPRLEIRRGCWITKWDVFFQAPTVQDAALVVAALEDRE